MAKSLYMVDDMLKKVRNFDIFDYKERGFIDNGKNNSTRKRN